MHIRKLELQGFKSFPDRTAFHFGPGISGVVGPNGCGKSNIVDAIKWCLGEQSAKSLRGQQMQDIIFAGSSERTPMGLAEVSLAFAAGNEPFPGEYARLAELQVSRRLFRDGHSEYLINQQKVRLRDIQDLFLDSGVGNRMYSFIEQGRIGQIVNARPEQRRSLIEEAAGISRYKARREEADVRLTSTAQNLDRARDVVDDLAKRLAALERQVGRAMRYRRLRSRIQQLEIALGLARYAALSGDRRALAQSLVQAEHAEADAIREVERLEEELTRTRAAMELLNVGVTRTRDRLAELEATRREKEAARQYQTREQETLQARLLTLAERQRAGQGERDAAAQRQARAEQERGQVEERLAALQGELEASRDEVRQAEAALSERRRRIEDAKAAVLRYVKELANKRAGQESSITRLRELKQRRSELDQRRGRAGTDLEASEAALVLRVAEDERATTAVELAREGLERARRVLREEEARQTNATQVVRAKERALAETERAESRLRARLDSLQELQRTHAGVEDDLRPLLARPGVKGVLAEHLDVPPELMIPVAAALAAHLDAILVESDAVAIELAAAVRGRAELLILDLSLPDPQGPLAGLAVSPQGRAALAALLSNCAGADNLAAALQARREEGVAAVVMGEVAGEGSSRFGFVDPQGSVRIGEPRAAGTAILARRREISVLTEQLEACAEESRLARLALEEARQEVEALSLAVGGTRASLEKARSDASEAEISAHEARRARQQGIQERDRQQAELKRLLGEDGQLEDTIARVAEQLTALDATIQQLQGSQERLETELQRDQAAIIDESRDLGRARERLNAVNAEAAGLRERVAGLRRSAEEAASALQSAERLLSETTTEAEAGRSRVAELAQDDARLIAELQSIGEEQGTWRVRLEEEKERLGREREQVEQRETQIRRSRDRREEATARRQGLDREVSRVKEEIARIRSQLEERYEISVAGLLDRMDRVGHVLVEADPGARDSGIPGLGAPTGKDASLVEDMRIVPAWLEDETRISAWVEELQSAKKELGKLGEVNLVAVREYAEVAERHEALLAQKKDLEESVQAIRQTIARLNKICRERFRETFDRVDAYFQEIYPKLVGGGQARLQLTDEEDLLETGVEIVVQPPGKRLQSLSLLSGGETAMVAIALIFSLFRVKPSPFCLLDEVDAPLDEGNGARFNRMLKEMSELAQFVVVTHNKKTMECADTLYGVTMNRPGVSQLVTVKLD